MENNDRIRSIKSSIIEEILKEIQNRIIIEIWSIILTNLGVAAYGMATSTKKQPQTSDLSILTCWMHQWRRKIFKAGRDYFNNPGTFVWRKITFLWRSSKIRGVRPPSLLSAAYGMY